MSYEDLLRKYQRLDRTRIFGPDWRITQQWTSLHVPWSADYHQTRFAVNVTRTTPVVIVLSQLDENYFAGLDGQYAFKLQFRVHKVGDEDDYIVRSNQDYYMTRSVSTDITLEAGSYFVLMKITATRHGGPTIDEIISHLADSKREKLIQVGLSYDIAHAKGVIVETEKEKEERELHEKAEAAALRERRKNEIKAQKEEQWKKLKKFQQRQRSRAERRAKRAEEKAAARGFEQTNDGYYSDGKNFPTPPPDANLSGMGASFTGELISSYERSEHPSPAMPDPENVSGTKPANGNQKEAAWGDEATRPVENESKDHPPTPKVQINGVDAVTDVRPLKRRPAPLDSRGPPPQRSEEPDERQRKYQREAEEPPMSDFDSESEFDWQTDLDYDSDDFISPSEAARRDRDRDSRRDEDGDEDSDQPEPWNAVCVVGLRVYSKDPDLSLQVVRPNPYSNKIKQDVGGALDRDDPAKGAVAEKWAKTPMRESFDQD